MDPRVFLKNGDDEETIKMLGKRQAGNARGGPGRGFEKRTDRAILSKMGELYNRVFSRSGEKKEKWSFCETCYRFCRNCERSKQCRDTHDVWDTEVLRRTYDLENSKQMRGFLKVIQKEQTGRQDVEEMIPHMGTRGSKKTHMWNKREVERTPEKSKGEEEGENEESRE